MTLADIRERIEPYIKGINISSRYQDSYDILLDNLITDVIRTIAIETRFWRDTQIITVDKTVQKYTVSDSSMIGIIDARDNDELSLMAYFRLNNNYLIAMSQDWLDDNDGETFVVSYYKYPDINNISDDEFSKIEPALKAGLKYYLQSSVDGQIETAISNQNGIKYYQEKQALINSKPFFRSSEDRGGRNVRWL